MSSSRRLGKDAGPKEGSLSRARVGSVLLLLPRGYSIVFTVQNSSKDTLGLRKVSAAVLCHAGGGGENSFEAARLKFRVHSRSGHRRPGCEQLKLIMSLLLRCGFFELASVSWRPPTEPPRAPRVQVCAFALLRLAPPPPLPQAQKTAPSYDYGAFTLAVESRLLCFVCRYRWLQGPEGVVNTRQRARRVGDGLFLLFTLPGNHHPFLPLGSDTPNFPFPRERVPGLWLAQAPRVLRLRATSLVQQLHRATRFRRDAFQQSKLSTGHPSYDTDSAHPRCTSRSETASPWTATYPVRHPQHPVGSFEHAENYWNRSPALTTSFLSPCSPRLAVAVRGSAAETT